MNQIILQKDENMELNLSFARFGGHLKRNIKQEYNYQGQSGCNLDVSADFPKVHLSISLSNKTVKSRNIVPKIIFSVKDANSIGLWGKSRLAPMKLLANQAAEMLTDNPENALSKGFCRLSTICNLANGKLCVN